MNTFETIKRLRKEIILNSLFVGDYENTFGFDAHKVCDFFDGYVEFLEEIEEDENDENLERWCYIGDVGFLKVEMD